ncbi:hypothetical protein CEXT_45381 [Caerostris extrusa]|uniref:Uncharacterized protein n=1 Tax=Caerostris extrusa TaxID=172846 RepID=A0AAV4VKW3_CAEEX|nr:hypothetical protein CEXT_45381 [Caerostris extrusa]
MNCVSTFWSRNHPSYLNTKLPLWRLRQNPKATDAQQRRFFVIRCQRHVDLLEFRVEARCVEVQRSGAQSTLDDNRAALGTKTASKGPVMWPGLLRSIRSGLPRRRLSEIAFQKIAASFNANQLIYTSFDSQLLR